MTPNHIGALLCRALGLLLIIVDAPSLLLTLLYGVQSGFLTVVLFGPSSGDTFDLFLRHHFPHLVGLLAGVALLWLNRVFGRLLASGLSELDPMLNPVPAPTPNTALQQTPTAGDAGSESNAHPPQ